ncbi:MAG: hypothetical protein ACYC0B_11155 [Gemmatimonadaceae bacterium]
MRSIERLSLRLPALLVVLGLAAACSPSEDAAPPATVASVGHYFHDSTSGLMLDLPSNWRGRYRVAAGITEPLEGLKRELSLNFVRADSTIATDAPMLVALVVDRDAWQRTAVDSTAARFGNVEGGDRTRTLVVRRATSNPFTAGTADAVAYDSLMVALYQRPLRTALRPPAPPVTRGPDAPAASSP